MDAWLRRHRDEVHEVLVLIDEPETAGHALRLAMAAPTRVPTVTARAPAVAIEAAVAVDATLPIEAAVAV